MVSEVTDCQLKENGSRDCGRGALLVFNRTNCIGAMLWLT